MLGIVTMLFIIVEHIVDTHDSNMFLVSKGKKNSQQSLSELSPYIQYFILLCEQFFILYEYIWV
jgi:hypothetical protein